ncbi:MAG: hypothetical protein AAF456_21410 [Planctomycetota bacterium]
MAKRKKSRQKKRKGKLTRAQYEKLLIKEIFDPPEVTADPEYYENFKALITMTGYFKSVRQQDAVDRKKIRTYLISNRDGDFEILLSDAEFQFVYSQCEDELKTERRIAEKALREREKYLTRKSFGPISGYTVGFRRKMGRVVAPLQYVIQMHVPCKHPDSSFERLGLRKFPRSVSTTWYGKKIRVPIKVIETCPEFAIANSSYEGVFADGTPDVQYIDPDKGTLVGGDPIAPEGAKKKWGTFGMKIPDANNGLVGVTNAHVVAKNESEFPGDKLNVCNPPGGDVFANVKEEDWSFKKTGKLDADAALLRIKPGTNASGDILGFPKNVEFLFLSNFIQEEHVQVFKFGAATQERKRGIIENRNFDSLSVSGRKFGPVLQIKGYSNKTIIDQGDSGSVLVAPVRDKKNDEKNAFLIVGLVFAMKKNDPSIAYACHWKCVAKRLNIVVKQELLRSASEVTLLGHQEKSGDWFNGA